MSRTKLFLENFFAYGLINILDKIIPMLLLPVITRLVADPSDFGVYDMYNLIIGFGSPLVVLGMYDAMFREYFERDDQQYKLNVTVTANRVVLLASFFASLFFVLFNSSLSKLFFGTPIYGSIIIFSVIGMVLSSNRTIIAAPTRMQNQRKVYVVSGLLGSLSQYGLAVLLISLGYSYYGLIFAHLTSLVFLLFFYWVLNKKFFTKGEFDKNIAKELFGIGLPLVPVFLIYWIYNSMDRIMLANMLGTTEMGIYAVGAKVASISTFIYAAFAGGWQYFAFSTMKDEDQVVLNSKVFEYLSAISFLSLIVIYPFVTPLFTMIFPEDYAAGIAVVPYLYLSPLLLMLFQIVGNQFLVIKKSYWSTITLGLGALVNVLLNRLLIPLLGIEGAAIATLLGYSLSVIIVCTITSKLNLHKTSRRALSASAILVIYLVVARLVFYGSIINLAVSSVFCVLLYYCMFRKEINSTLNKGKSLTRKKVNQGN